MKSTVSINIQGVVFHADEATHQLLSDYLSSIRAHFERKGNGDEIVNDIEMRIVELLAQRVDQSTRMIDKQDVEDVMGLMGTPSDFDNEESRNESKRVLHYPRRKRLYRDIDHRMIGGVCSGLGAYFRLDPTLFRLIFVVATVSGLSPFLYIILWIVVPPARTIADKLEMYGEPVNISNIEKAIREEVGNLRDRFGEYAGRAKSTFKGNG
ncbi:MAG: PspC domain-containing protein [Bacteroidales bacterium]|nr:PspC domain-containing protein [Bacteroidales bacterium]